MIVDDDILFFSKDDDFIQPESNHTENLDQAGRSEGERLPNSVGGYKVGELLGRGGFGEVRLGEHQLTGERVALKFLRKTEIQSLGAAERTNTEIQCLATLKHMNIIRLMQVRRIRAALSSKISTPLCSVYHIVCIHSTWKQPITSYWSSNSWKAVIC